VRKPNTSAIFFILAILAFSQCGTPGKNMPVTEGIAVIGNDRMQEINIAVENFYFIPSRITVVVNVPVRLIMQNHSHIVPHNISLHAPDAGLDIDQNIGLGKKVIVEFTPTKIGEYPFFCDKDGHAKKGMQGTLIVRDSQ
jgi:plastocyanin domain-containing protein